jgi:hypothetical protein
MVTANREPAEEAGRPMAGRVVVTLEELEAARLRRIPTRGPVGSEEERYRQEQATKGLMADGGTSKRGAKTGKRPVGHRATSTTPRVPAESLNAGMIASCPGSSQHPGLDYVKAVYADRTGQE